MVEGVDVLDVVVVVVIVLEDLLLFNAGKGLVLMYNEMVEMDVLVMYGVVWEVGVIVGVCYICNLI